MGAFQSTTMRERAQALLAGAVTLAMAASLAVVGAPVQQAYADEDVPIAVQAEDGLAVDEATLLTLEDISGGADGFEGSGFVGGVKLVLSSSGTASASEILGDYDVVTLNGQKYDYKALKNKTASNGFNPSGATLYLTKEALNLDGENTVVYTTDDYGEYTFTFRVGDASETVKESPVFSSAKYVVDEYFGDESVSVGPDGSLEEAYYKAVTSVNVNGTAYTFTSGSFLGENEFAAGNSVNLGMGAFKNGENEVVISAAGYKDVTFTVIVDKTAKTAAIKSDDPTPMQIVDATWEASFKAVDSLQNAVVLSASEAPAEFVNALSAVAVNGTVHEPPTGSDPDYGMLIDSNFKCEGSSVQIGLDGFVDGENTVTLSAAGYEDVVLTVYYNSAKKIASSAEIVDVADSLANGEYTFTTKAINESSYGPGKENKEFNLASQFDPNIKLAKSDDGLTLSLLYTQAIDMQKIAIDGVEATKASFGQEELGAYIFTAKIADLAQPHKLSFTYDTGVMGVRTSSVYLTEYAAAEWSGYATVVTFGETELLKGSANPHTGAVTPRTYSVPVALKNASDTTKDSMAKSALSPNGELVLDAEGNATVRLSINSVMGVYATDFKVDGIAATVTQTRKTADGEVPAAIEFALPESAKTADGVGISMTVGEPMNREVPAFVKIDYPAFGVLTSDDVAAIDDANAKLAALPAADAVVADDKDAIEAARAAYNALTDAQKAIAGSEEPLKAAEDKLAEIEKDAADKAEDDKNAQDAAKAEANLANATVTVAKKSVAYTGKAQKPAVTVKSKSGKTLKAGADYAVSYSANKAVGTAKVTVTGKGKYTGKNTKATFKITQAANSAKAAKTSVKKSFKKATVKKKAQTVALPKVTAKFGTAKWSVAKKDAKKVLSLKNGKVVVKKGAKKGTYTIQLKASVAKTKNYKAATTKPVTVKVTVK